MRQEAEFARCIERDLAGECDKSGGSTAALWPAAVSSVCLALHVAFWLQLDNPYWAGTTAALVCQPQLGASLRRGWFRMIGTVVGGAAVVVLTACFPQDRVLFLDALALWGGASALAAALLRNFAAYAAALAGYTAAIVAGDLLGATGEINADAAFLLAVTRCSEICVGIVCAGVILAGTDFGGPQRGPEVLATSERAARQRAERFYSPAAAEVERVPGELTKALPIVGGGSRRWRRGWRRHAWGAIPMPNAATHTPAAVSSEVGSCSRSI